MISNRVYNNNIDNSANCIDDDHDSIIDNNNNNNKNKNKNDKNNIAIIKATKDLLTVKTCSLSPLKKCKVKNIISF